jgi:murein L,D-transpeptidase YafK
MLAVDKASQHLYLVAGNAPLRIAASYVCTTGQVKGDKLAQGDLKTPEGIYFIVRRLSSGLDYTLYGNEAYTLNYPNPVDKLRRKTGYGIWLHGRGERISPLQTQGCIALNNEDLASLGKFLQPGIPVTLTETYRQRETALGRDAETIKNLRTKVLHWAETWSGRSVKLFDFYDKASYSIAQEEPFAVFQKQKERLFRTLPWIKTTVRDIQVLPGPDYWVTWFFQEYSAPNLSTQGVRRLYWQPNEKGEFKIVGMEWIPGTTTSLLLAGTDLPVEAAARLDGRREGGGQAISEEQAVPLPEALAAAERSRSVEAPALAAAEAENTLTPEERVIMPEQDSSAQEAPPLPETARLQARTAPKAESAPRPSLDHVEDPRLGKMAEPPQAATLRLAQAKAAPEEAPANAPRPPLASSSSQEQPVPESSPPRKKTPSGEPAGGREQAPPGKKDSSPVPSEARKAAPAAEDLLREKVEAWRKAWQQGDLERYCKFYDSRATQEKRTSAEAIRRHKRALWAKAAPARVELTDLKISVEGNTATAVMRQKYADARGGNDKGLKTLVWRLSGNVWLITKETWSADP